VGTSGNYSHTGTAKFGNTVTLSGAFGVTGAATFSGTFTAGVTATVSGNLIVSGSRTEAKRFYTSLGTIPSFAKSSGWGVSATLTQAGTNSDQAFSFMIYTEGTGIGASPTVTATFGDGTWYVGGVGPPFVAVTSRADYPQAKGFYQPTVPFIPSLPISGTTLGLTFWGTPITGETYVCSVIIMGVSTQ
jgi:hypothetical protein